MDPCAEAEQPGGLRRLRVERERHGEVLHVGPIGVVALVRRKVHLPPGVRRRQLVQRVASAKQSRSRHFRRRLPR